MTQPQHGSSCCSISGVRRRIPRCVALQANWLKAQGIKKGDAVAIYMPMLCELPISMVRRSAPDQPCIGSIGRGSAASCCLHLGVFTHGLYASQPRSWLFPLQDLQAWC